MKIKNAWELNVTWIKCWWAFSSDIYGEFFWKQKPPPISQLWSDFAATGIKPSWQKFYLSFTMTAILQMQPCSWVPLMSSISLKLAGGTKTRSEISDCFVLREKGKIIKIIVLEMQISLAHKISTRAFVKIIRQTV